MCQCTHDRDPSRKESGGCKCICVHHAGHLVVQGVKTVPHNAAGAGSIPDQGAKTPRLQVKTQSRNNTVTNLAKTLKMVHMEKKNQLKWNS